MGALEDKARKARIAAKEAGSTARDTARRNASTAGIKLTMGEERKATKVLKDRIQIDRSKTAARATNIAKTQAKKTAAKRVATATGNSQSKAKAPMSSGSKLSQSEKDFLAGQKYKAKVTKKTGVYPNTAN